MHRGGGGGCGLARVDCPTDAPEPPAAHHGRASTAHTAPRAGRPWPYPYWASRGASSCCLAAPDHRREGERTRSAGAGVGTRGQAPRAAGYAARLPGPTGLPTRLTIHPIVLLIAPLAQDGGRAVIDDRGRPGGRQATEHTRHALHRVGLGRARVGLCREQQRQAFGCGQQGGPRHVGLRMTAACDPETSAHWGVPPACTSGRLGNRGRPGGGQAPWLVSPRPVGDRQQFIGSRRKPTDKQAHGRPAGPGHRPEDQLTVQWTGPRTHPSKGGPPGTG